MRTISRKEIKDRNIKSSNRKDVYEIYIFGGPEMVSGWEIKWVVATKEGLKSYPNFDCVISKNDTPHTNKKIINWI